MPRKKFDEVPYNPIAADLVREVAVGAKGEAFQPILHFAQSSEKRLDAVDRRSQVEKSPTPAIEREEPTITKRFVLTRSEDADVADFLLRLQKRSGTKVPLSVIARSLLNIAMQAEEQIAAEIETGFSRPLPSTHDTIGLADFEDRWMRCLANALRKMPRPRW